MMTLTLPFPPSANNLWRHVNGKPMISKSVRVYRREVYLAVLSAKEVGGPLSVGVTGFYLPLVGRLALDMILIPKNAQRRDLDNHIKVVQDALTHAGFWQDDVQVDDVRIRRGAVDAQNPRLILTISVL